jgi:hypothetical protein
VPHWIFGAQMLTKSTMADVLISCISWLLQLENGEKSNINIKA